MPSNYDDSTEPIPTDYNATPTQGKFVVGGFQNQPSQRRPYQYPPPQPGQYPYVGQGPYIPPNQRGAAGQYNPNVAPYQQPGAYNPNAAPRTSRKKRRNRGCRIGCLTMLVLMIIVIVLGVITVPRVLAFGSAISTQPPLSMSGDMGTNNRTNLLILGYGGTGHDGAYLTDSMLVVSLLPQSHHTSLVSIPRDTWVDNPFTQTKTKINAIYESASNNNQDPAAGGKATADTVGSITGLNTKYWMTINFTGFRDLINSIGGVDVYVPDSFSSEYPANDDPAIDASYKVVTFTKGNQHMDGETAIEYARARKTIDNPAEGTDFARAARQQIIIKAAISKIKQITTWPKLFDALNALEQTIRTNLSLADLIQFTLDMDLESPQTAHIGLSVDNVMAYGTSDDGQSIVVPQNNNWGAVANYVQQHLYN